LVAADEPLINRLADELAHESGAQQPYILERHIELTGSRHVHVVWDEFLALPDIERTAVILEAYRRHEGDLAEDISVATGLTAREAFAFGLLPYKIVPTRRDADPLLPERYRAAMTQEAPHTLLQSVVGGELRYPTIDEAEKAFERLQTRLPGSRWAVVQESPIES
jgi:hypothetical protein